MLLAILIFCSCAKDVDPPAALTFKMNWNKLVPRIERATGTNSCPGTRDYEITASIGEQFFKINWQTDTLRAGSYTGTFWYTNEGSSYALYDLKINVTSYINGVLVAGFSGGIVTEGSVNLKINEY